MHTLNINPKVSCIVPVLNEKDTISDFMLSLFNQDFRPIELIIVDGGSRDGTIDVINSTARSFNDKLFSVFLFNENDFGTIASPANARNIGLDKSNGDFVFFIDSDTCFINKSTISKAISEINDQYFIIIYFRPIIDTKLEELISKTMKMDGILLYRKKFINNFRFIPTLGFGEDREFNFRLLGNFEHSKYIPCSITIGRHYPHSLSELKKQNEWYGRTIIKYLKAIDPLNKKEFISQISYIFYNFIMAIFPFLLLISLIFSSGFIIILTIFLVIQILIGFIKYKWTELDKYAFLIWYSLFNGFYFTKGLLSSLYKKNITGRNS